MSEPNPRDLAWQALEARGPPARSPDELYDTIKHWASEDGTSINSWMQEAIEREVFRRRCMAHGQWLEANPALRSELLACAEAAAAEVDDLRREGAA